MLVQKARCILNKEVKANSQKHRKTVDYLVLTTGIIIPY